jgi:hypothetical protein
VTDEQKAAFVIAQCVCATADIEAMKAANAQYPQHQPYGEEAFSAIPEKYGIYHDAVISLFHQ